MNPPLRIVVADDEPDIREYFLKILPRLGYKVVAVAENGQELIELCRRHEPDLLITDVKMPQLDGIAASEAIYKERPLPVILISAYSDPDLLERAEADHVMGYFVKPIKKADLAPAIALAVKRFRQIQNLEPKNDGVPKPCDPTRNGMP